LHGTLVLAWDAREHVLCASIELTCAFNGPDGLSWYVIKHFIDVYLYLFFLIGLSVGVTAYFKEVVLDDCSLSQATYW
jgi:hypothetical protein